MLDIFYISYEFCDIQLESSTRRVNFEEYRNPQTYIKKKITYKISFMRVTKSQVQMKFVSEIQ